MTLWTNRRNRLLACAQLLLGGPALGQIAGNLGIADQIAGRVADRIDDDVCPEAAAVLAYTPAFGLEPAFASRRLERDPRYLPLLFLWRVKAGEMLPDDLARLIAFETPRALIPAANPPLQIEHINRVVGNALNQQLKPAARARRIFGVGHGASCDTGRMKSNGMLSSNTTRFRPFLVSAPGAGMTG